MGNFRRVQNISVKIYYGFKFIWRKLGENGKKIVRNFANRFSSLGCSEIRSKETFAFFAHTALSLMSKETLRGRPIGPGLFVESCSKLLK